LLLHTTDKKKKKKKKSQNHTKKKKKNYQKTQGRQQGIARIQGPEARNGAAAARKVGGKASKAFFFMCSVSCFSRIDFGPALK
jgi:hypothetical protein